MAVLNVEWGTLARVSPVEAVVTPDEDTEGTDEEAPKPLAEKPFIVWIQDPLDEEANGKITKTVLDPDKVRVGTNYFKCVKMTEEEAKADPLLAESGKKLPRMVFVTHEYKVAAVVEGKISSSKVYAAMKKTAKKSYKGNFDRSVKSVIKLLGKLDKIANDRKMLSQKEAKDPKPAELKKIAKEKEALEEEEKEVLDERKRLLTPELKAA